MIETRLHKGTSLKEILENLSIMFSLFPQILEKIGNTYKYTLKRKQKHLG